MSDYIRVSWYCAIQTTKDPQQLKTTFNSYAISICELKRRSSGTLSFYSQHKRVTMTPQCTQSFIVNQSHCSVLIQVRLFTQIPAFVAEKMRIGDLQIRGHSKKNQHKNFRNVWQMSDLRAHWKFARTGDMAHQWRLIFIVVLFSRSKRRFTFGPFVDGFSNRRLRGRKWTGNHIHTSVLI